MQTGADNKRIIRNTIMLYIRMVFSMLVSLYTSRVILNTLGVEDYGIYGVVGGLVSMFSFLNASMSGATSRFLSFELGRGNLQQLKDTFSSALVVHVGIAFIIFVLAETIGLWFLINKLVIPEDRMYAAHWVYQLSILTMMINVTQVPYNASIMSRERMDVYAYIEILNTILKLIIVLLLMIGEFDKLILYAVLSLVVSVSVTLFYRLYCIRNFRECHFSWVINLQILKPILFFSGWDLYGNMCYVERTQGVNFLLNIFFGATLNATNGISSTVNGVILGFAGNIVNAFRSPIVKAYAQNDTIAFQSLFENATRYFSLLLLFITIPICIEIDSILDLWLGVVPQYTGGFCCIVLITNCITMPSVVVTIAIHSTGRIKMPSFVIGTFYLLVPVISYLFLKLGYGVYTVYLVNSILVVSSMFVNFILLKNRISYWQIGHFIKRSIIPIYIVALLTVIPSFMIYGTLDKGVTRLIIIVIASWIILSITSFFIVLTDSERKMVLNKFYGFTKLIK